MVLRRETMDLQFKENKSEGELERGCQLEHRDRQTDRQTDRE